MNQPSVSQIELRAYKTLYLCFFIISFFLFISFSVSALYHILLIFPGFYFLSKSLQQKEKNHFEKSFWALLILSFICILSVLFNYEDIAKPFKNMFKVKYFLFSLLAVFPLRYWFKYQYSAKKIRTIVSIFAICSAIASLSGLIGLYTGFNPLRFKDACHATRTCGMYGMYMTYAYGIQFVVIILFGLIVAGKKRFTPWILAPVLYTTFAINLAGFMLSHARGAYAGFFLAIPFFFFKKSKKSFLLVILLLSLLSSGLYLSSSKIQNMFNSGSRGHSNLIRISQWQTAWMAFKSQPILGVGYKNFEPQVKAFKKKWNIGHAYFSGHAHSNFFEHLAATGFLGFLVLLLFHLFWLIEMYRRDDLWGQLMFPVVIAFFISGQVQYTFGDGENLFLILTLFSLSHVVVKKNNHQEI